MGDIEKKFADKLSSEEIQWIRDKYVSRAYIDGRSTVIANLKKQVDKYEKEMLKIIDGRIEARQEQIERTHRNEIATIKNEYITEIKELTEKLEKWKAMYTGQCEANKILVNMLGGKENE